MSTVTPLDVDSHHKTTVFLANHKADKVISTYEFKDRQIQKLGPTRPSDLQMMVVPVITNVFFLMMIGNFPAAVRMTTQAGTANAEQVDLTFSNSSKDTTPPSDLGLASR